MKTTNYATSRIVVMPEFIDMEPPSITLVTNWEKSCKGVPESKCKQSAWSARVLANDTLSGLKSITARNLDLGVIGPTCTINCTFSNATFTFAEEFEEGHTGIVDGTFKASCCVMGVEVFAVDMAGNLDTRKMYHEKNAGHINTAGCVLLTVVLFKILQTVSTIF